MSVSHANQSQIKNQEVKDLDAAIQKRATVLFDRMNQDCQVLSNGKYTKTQLMIRGLVWEIARLEQMIMTIGKHYDSGR